MLRGILKGRIWKTVFYVFEDTNSSYEKKREAKQRSWELLVVGSMVDNSICLCIIITGERGFETILPSQFEFLREFLN